MPDQVAGARGQAPNNGALRHHQPGDQAPGCHSDNDNSTNSTCSNSRGSAHRLNLVLPQSRKGSLLTPTIVTSEPGAPPTATSQLLLDSIAQLNGQAEVSLFTGLPSCTPTSADRLAASGINPFFWGAAPFAGAQADQPAGEHQKEAAKTADEPRDQSDNGTEAGAGASASNNNNARHQAKPDEPGASGQPEAKNSKGARPAANLRPPLQLASNFSPIILSPLSIFGLSPEQEAWLRLGLSPSQHLIGAANDADPEQANVYANNNHHQQPVARTGHQDHLHTANAPRDLTSQPAHKQHQQPQQQQQRQQQHHRQQHQNHQHHQATSPHANYQHVCPLGQTSLVTTTTTTSQLCNNINNNNNLNQTITSDELQAPDHHHLICHQPQSATTNRQAQAHINHHQHYAFETHHYHHHQPSVSQQPSIALHPDSGQPIGLFDPHLRQIYLQYQHQPPLAPPPQPAPIYAHQQNPNLSNIHYIQQQNQQQQQQPQLQQLPLQPQPAIATCSKSGHNPVEPKTLSSSNSALSSFNVSPVSNIDPLAASTTVSTYSSSACSPVARLNQTNNPDQNSANDNSVPPATSGTGDRGTPTKKQNKPTDKSSVQSTTGEAVVKKKSKGGRKKKLISQEEMIARKNRSKERNRVAAKRCRQKRKQFLDTLRDRIESLNDMNNKLQKENSILKSQLELIKRHHDACRI